MNTDEKKCKYCGSVNIVEKQYASATGGVIVDECADCGDCYEVKKHVTFISFFNVKV